MLIAQTPHFRVHRLFAHNSLRNYTYVLVESASQRAWVIDPWDGEETRVWAREQQVVLSGILNTHQHHDHIRGNAVLTALGVPVLAGIEDVAPGVAQKITWRAPGHTMEHVVYLLEDGGQRHCFVGDTLFQAGVGNCKNGGDPEVLFQTVRKLGERMTAETFVHPGHDYLARNAEFALHVDPQNAAVQALVSGLASPPETHTRPARQWKEELATNPFLRTDSPALRLATGADSDEMVFTTLRRMRDTW